MSRPTDEHGTRTREWAWQTLIEAGLPLGAAHPRRDMPTADSVAEATLVVGSDPARLSTIERETLFAFLCAWRQHWQSSFDAHLGAAGHALVAYLDGVDIDLDRYLKLKRIAVQHLARGF